MGKLAYIKRQLTQADQKEKEALDKTLNKAVSEGVSGSVKAVQDALDAHAAALRDNQGEGTAKSIKAVEKASEALNGAVNSLIEHVYGMEAQVLAEIRGIKFPDQKETDLTPVLEAIKGLPVPEKVEIPSFEMPDFPDMPRVKAIVPKRNRNTSLVERYELEY